MVKLRIRPNNKDGFFVQKKEPVGFIFHRWKNIYECNTFGEALLFKTNFIPKEVLEGNAPSSLSTSGRLYEKLEQWKKKK